LEDRQCHSGRTEDGEAFWRFSLAFYARPGVAEALLRLQDRCGRDVNLALFALWSGAALSCRLAPADLARAQASAKVFRDAVEPVRALRRKLKTEDSPDIREFRGQVAALELRAERGAQHRLAANFEHRSPQLPVADRLAAAAANLELYLGADLAGSAAARRLLDALAEFLRL
jgi:uncharacterized protein (TIGR02444 family)